jgi:hypothetical protein
VKAKAKIWLHNLLAATITGAATSGLSALGISVADAAGGAIKPLDMRQLMVLFASGAAVGLLAYLKQSPLPPGDL